MSSLLPFASEPHGVWSPFAREIHTVVWDNVGLPKVQEYVRQWAAEYGRLWDAWEAEKEKACTDNKHYNPGSPQLLRHIESNWSESLEIDERECRRLLPPLLIGAKPPEEPSLPLPPAHREFAVAEKWAGLAAVHDHYWLGGEKILPWDEPPDGEVDEAWVRWEDAAGWFRVLMGEAEKLDKGYRPCLANWLTEVRGTRGEEGPIEPDGFVWQGVTYRGLARKPFFAVRYLWGQTGKAARTDDLAEPVWEDPLGIPDEEAVRGLRREINAFFRDKGIPWHATVKNQCLAICSGPPQSRKPKSGPKGKAKRGAKAHKPAR